MPNPPFPLLRFVAAPSLDAEVFFDFNPHGIKPDSFSLGSPSYLGDVDAIAPSLGFRSVSFTAHFASSKFDNARDAVRLSREMARDRNWLLWWSDDKVPPVWFRTYPSAPGAVSWDWWRPFGESDMLALPLVIDADAAMLGERVDLGEYAIANDPQGVAESDPANAYTRLPEIKGDLPAPLHVRVGDTGSLQPLLVTASSWPRRMWAQTSTVTGGSTGSDATASAGSYVTRTLTSSYQQVARATIDNIWHAGRYRVLARVRTSGAGGENIRFRLVNGEARKLATGEWTVVDLGVIAVPRSNLPPPGATQIWSQEIYLEALRTSGSAALHVDYMALAPASIPGEQVTTFDARVASPVLDPGGAQDWIWIDGESRLCGVLDRVHGVGDFYPSRPAAIGFAGGFPHVFPGSVNAMAMYPRQALGGDALTFTPKVQLSYHPRYLILPGA